MMNQIISELFKRPVAYHPAIAKAFGSVKFAVLWSQLYYWSDKTKDPDGWIYKTMAEIYEETGLARKEQETARAIGRTSGLLEEKLAGKPATLHFKLNIPAACEALEKYFGTPAEIKESKRDASPVKSIAYLRDIPEEDVREIATKYKVSPQCVLKRADDVIDYCEAKGKSYRDYKAALRNFIKIHIERHPQDIIRESAPAPQILETRAQRTPEEQKRIDEQLARMRESMKTFGKKFTM